MRNVVLICVSLCCDYAQKVIFYYSMNVYCRVNVLLMLE